MFIVLSVGIFIVCFISCFMFRDEPYSIHKVLNIFYIFFFSIAPVIQHNENVIMWGGNNYNQFDYEYTSFVLFFCILIYNIGYIMVRYMKPKKSSFNFQVIENPPLSIKMKTRIFFITTLSFLLMLYLNGFSLFSLLFRGGELTDSRVHISNSSLNLIIGNYIKPMPLIAFAIIIITKSKSKVLIIYTGLLTLLTCSPTSMPRFMVAALYLPIFILLFPKFISARHRFVTILVLSLLILFPFLNNFRYYDPNSELQLGLNFDMFAEGHFDAYSVFLRILKEDITTFGYQFLGVVFFWIPRAVWSNKPVGSGYFTAEKLNLDFENISCPYFAEGYINGGFIGVCLFILVLIFITAKLDYWYWTKLKRGNSIDSIIYYLLLGLFFFIMRGDLLSSSAFTIGIILSVITVKKILYLK